jgi:hypothetical protein
MTESLFEKVKQNTNIKEVIEWFGHLRFDRKNKALCPFHDDHKPSLSIKESDGIFKCFTCDVSGDAIDFVAKLKDIEPLEAAKLIAEEFRINTDNDYAPSKRVHSAAPKKEQKLPQKDEPTADQRAAICAYVESCIAHAGETDYFAMRGLTPETVKRFSLGYDPKQKCIVMPYSGRMEYYMTRSVEGKQFYKPASKDAGQEPLFNRNALLTKGVVFVVESPLCAMSIAQCGGQAVALCGTGIRRFVMEATAHRDDIIFVLALDNDTAGASAQAELARGLFDESMRFLPFNVSGDCKDPNELLMKSPDTLKQNVETATVEAKRKYSKLKSLFRMCDLQKKELKPTRWIVDGLLPEGLALLAAPSKYGKSWMMMQLCLAVTKGLPFLEHRTEQCDCAYFTLEDGIGRLKKRINIMTNCEPTPPGFMSSVESCTMANGLFAQFEELLDTYPKMGLIIIDTFQKVRTGQMKNESVYAADYREMGQLKSFADKHGICLLLIHHLRKMDDDSDVFNRINGSMAMMGAADTTWILARKKRNDINTTLTVTGRDIDEDELIVTFDKPTVTWTLVGNPEDEAARNARREYEQDPVIKTIKSLIKKQPSGWRGNCTEMKLKIYEETGAIYTKSVETIGKTIKNYADRLLADGITHTEERGKRHFFQEKRATLFGMMDDDED